MKGKLGLCLLGVGVVIVLLVASRDVCVSTWLNHDLTLDACPSGTMRLVARVTASDLRRGEPGTIGATLTAHYMVEDSDEERTTALEDFQVRMTLIGPAGEEKPLPAKKGWRWENGERRAMVVLPPDLADGDYRLRARVTASVGAETVEIPIGVYAPARVHVLSDRPLYEPGNVVRFRAVVLRARDLQPIEGRPGLWIVEGPDGEVLLEEKAPTGPWGVVAGSFPLDHGAEHGLWKVRWVSGDASDERPFTVEPFTLPRFRVEAATDRPFYGRGASPIVKGQVTYSSGAPVAGAAIEVTWSAQGEWPPPRDWMDTLLPRRATTGANGRFELRLPAVPADLRGQFRLVAQLAAVDPAGDRVAGGATVLLAEDPIDVQAVSELGEGLVPGFNNRLYLRVTSADGRPLEKGPIEVRRAWSPADPPIEAPLDEDGVAAIQVDPGPPVNVVIPAMPPRPAAPAPLVALGELETILAAHDRDGEEGGEASLADHVAAERWLQPLSACAKYAGSAEDEAADAVVAVRVDPSGRILAAVTSRSSALDGCVRAIVSSQKLAPGGERLYTLTFGFREPDLPSLGTTWQGVVGETPEGLEEQIETATRSARDCLPLKSAEAELPQALTWRTHRGETAVQLDWMTDPDGMQAGADALKCLKTRLGKVALPDKAPADAMGLVRLTVSPAPSIQGEESRDTVMLGYELEVETAEGKTKIRLGPGAVPPLRLRATPVLVEPGAEIAVEAIRGPEYRGDLPRELALEHARGTVQARLDAGTRTARFVLAGEKVPVEGWCEITGGGGRALVYVKPKGDLQVQIAPEQPRYAPGQMARLALSTKIGGQGAPAAVGLVGVDATMAQLAPLPGADELARLRPTVEMTGQAFGNLDAQALVLGRIRGANAAAATILRVGSFPRVPDKDAPVGGLAQTKFDPVEELTDRFYLIQGELYGQVRRWEAEAPKSEKMHPATMAKLWGQALAAVKKRGERVDDAYGRDLTLSRVPRDLLALIDPHDLIVDGTRLPEDVENWIDWVERVRP